ncbi:histidine kinase [[Bacillus] caldolyticus]|uniref:Histidine kinase n=1 Tax=Bacillus caldolyticus TaxID=1394 RepID=A0ABM6QIP8_BACCL|nr:histidine kinase [[Bacillus] caldolyticus]
MRHAFFSLKDKKPFFIIPYCFLEDYCYNCLYSNNFMDKNVLFAHYMERR